MNKKKIYYLITIALVFVVGICFLFYNQSDKTLIEAKHTNRSFDNKLLSIMLETSESSGTYETNPSNSWPQEGYVFNESLSKCEHGGELSWDDSNNKVVFKGNKSDKCYIYFDIHKIKDAQALITDAILWNSGLENDGYRYVGTDPDNYICFGTTDLSQCKSNTDAYMYRIIGVFSDSDGNQHMKLIKKESLNTGLAWHADKKTEANWGDSDLYKTLNGSTFLTNTTYIPSTTWSNKITNWTWSAINTRTNSNSGPDFYDYTSKLIYSYELHKTTSTLPRWTTPSGKIGLMYVSDFYLSLGSVALNYGASNSKELSTGWMFISNNDSGAPSISEWTISRPGPNNNETYLIYDICSVGYASRDSSDYLNSVRPVFYLNSDIEIKNGTGTIDDPYIIVE